MKPYRDVKEVHIPVGKKGDVSRTMSFDDDERFVFTHTKRSRLAQAQEKARVLHGRLHERRFADCLQLLLNEYESLLWSAAEA